jgi:hypothetical protein
VTTDTPAVCAARRALLAAELPKWLGDLPDPLIPALGLAPEAT